MMIFLDTGPLWTICNPGAGEIGKSLRKAILSKMAAGHTIAVAEINDYEARREILRKNAQAQLARLEKTRVLVEETRMAQGLAQVHQGDGRHPRSATVTRPLGEGKRATVAPGGWLRHTLMRGETPSTHSKRRGAEKMLTMAAYHPIDTALMKAAAALWAQLRNAGAAGADDHALDGDVILVAQALRFPDHLIVTDNVKHFTGLCNVQSRTDFILS